MRVALLAPVLLIAAVACGGSDDLLVGVASSVHDSGLAEELVAAFEEANPDVGDVKPIPAGSGQLAELARRGEVDVIITHEPQVEADLLAEGAVSERLPFMHNTFLLVGPPGDPAAVEGAETLVEAFARIAGAGATFVSRGDRSGTNVRELTVWAEESIVPEGESWYQESGAGQGQSLLVASDKAAYTMVDSATWRALEDRAELVEYVRDEKAPNVYSVLPVRGGEVNDDAARAFAEFLTSPAARDIIETFGVEEYGEPLFLPGPGDEATP